MLRSKSYNPIMVLTLSLNQLLSILKQKKVTLYVYLLLNYM